MKNKDTLILIAIFFLVIICTSICDNNGAKKVAENLSLNTEQQQLTEQQQTVEQNQLTTQNQNLNNNNLTNNSQTANNTNQYSKPIKDRYYKESIINSSRNSKFNIEKMDSILGPNEIKEFIKKNNNNPSIYTAESSSFRANLHIHTTASDGSMSQLELLNKAAALAQSKGDTIYIAITDHNTTEGAKKVVEILQANPEKYKNVKVLLGIEVYSKYNNQNTYNPIDIHVLCWGINPYDTELNSIFYKKNPSDKWNYSDRTFEDAIRLLNRKGIVGIAHPARYVEAQNLTTSYQNYYETLFSTYQSLISHTGFIEGYYQSYSGRSEFRNLTNNQLSELLRLINQIASNKNIVKTGSYDSHGNSILSR